MAQENATKLLIHGPAGRMGQTIAALARETPGVEVAGGIVRGSDSAPAPYPVAGSLPELLEIIGHPSGSSSQCVMIDFTAPDATMTRLDEAAQAGVPLVIGTTGFDKAQLDKISAAAGTLPVLLSANMSVGINVLLDVVKRLAEQLPGYDIEITETHHRLKKDAPSGTALALAQAAADGRELDLDNAARHGREGFVGERTTSEIGIHAVRGGDVVGDHTVLLAGIGERIEITHRASSRNAFAAGAIAAARWLVHQPPGLYSMQDVLATKNASE